MSATFKLREFPIDEINLLNKITSQFKNWDFVNIEQEDLVQEVLIKLLDNWDKWEMIRDNATSSSLIYISLKNYSIKVWNSEIKKQLPFSTEDIADTIQRLLKTDSGILVEAYFELSEGQQQYINEVYTPNRTYTKTSVKEKYGLSWSEVKQAELKITNAARFTMSQEMRGRL